MGVTVLGAAVPGAGYLWTGRRRLGYAVMAPALAAFGLLLFHVRDLDAIVSFAVDPVRLRTAAVLIATILLLWVVTVVTTYVMVRPPDARGWRGVVGATFVGALCLAVAIPAALGARYAVVQADLVTTVFEDNVSATAPRIVNVADPWAGRERVNVLLLGGDGGVGRSGLRTDTVMLLSIDTDTGDTVLFSLPRNMMNAQFPRNSRLRELYPDGFRGGGDPANWMLNAVYGQVPALHPGVLGESDNEGADAVKQAVSGSLGVPVDYYVLVNLQGFKTIVDAMGGVTVNINEPIPIQGSTDRGIPPVGYLQPGRNQRLDGYEALWYARGRYGSDDYDRMLRQRCMVYALIDEAQPLRLLRRYEALASAGKEIMRTDVPSDLLPALVDLGMKVKDARVRSLPFVSSDKFYPGDPDFDWLHSKADKALKRQEKRSGDTSATPTASPGGPRGTPSGADDPGDAETRNPGRAVDTADSCGYHPDR
jgi:LCP family protein required for cell wall assembly